MPSLSSLHRPDVVEYAVDIGGEPVAVAFDRAKMTGRWEREISKANAESDQDKVADLLLGVFVSWNVVDDNDQPVPITPEVLIDLPSAAIVKLLEGMSAAALPASAEGNAFANTSSSPSTELSSLPPNHPNGQPTSESLPSSASPSPT